MRTTLHLCQHLKPSATVKKNIYIENNINTEISKVATWLKSNMIKLNVKKSKFMIFFKHPKIITNFSITINNSTIVQVDHFNFLGVTLDQNITWNPHVDKVSIKKYLVLPVYYVNYNTTFQNIF